MVNGPHQHSRHSAGLAKTLAAKEWSAPACGEAHHLLLGFGGFATFRPKAHSSSKNNCFVPPHVKRSFVACVCWVAATIDAGQIINNVQDEHGRPHNQVRPVVSRNPSFSTSCAVHFSESPEQRKACELVLEPRRLLCLCVFNNKTTPILPAPAPAPQPPPAFFGCHS